MLKVGLTGGIACGKSYALRRFSEHGVYTIDSDKLAHSVMEKGKPAYKKIVGEFGPEILDSRQSIDRKKLGSIVFSDASALEKLNQIVHPFVFEEEGRQVESFQSKDYPRSPIIMVDAALMVEAGSYRKYDALVVVYCHPRIQLSRLISRDGVSEDEAQQRIHVQMPILEKIKYADYIIENSGKCSDVDCQIKQIFAELVQRCQEERT